MDEAHALEVAQRAIDRLGGFDALETLFLESHAPYPEHEFVIEDLRVVVRLRGDDRPATVYVGPYTFEVRGHQLVRAAGA